MNRQRMFSVVGALVTSERIAEPRPKLVEDLRNLHPKEKVLEVARKKIPKQNVLLGTIDLGSFEVLSDHGDAEEDDGDVDDRNCATAVTCLMVQEYRDFKAYRDVWREITESSIVGIGSMSSLMLCSKWILEHETRRILWLV